MLGRELSHEALGAPGLAVRLTAIAVSKNTPEFFGLDAAERASFACDL